MDRMSTLLKTKTVDRKRSNRAAGLPPSPGPTKPGAAKQRNQVYRYPATCVITTPQPLLPVTSHESRPRPAPITTTLLDMNKRRMTVDQISVRASPNTRPETLQLLWCCQESAANVLAVLALWCTPKQVVVQTTLQLQLQYPVPPRTKLSPGEGREKCVDESTRIYSQ